MEQLLLLENNQGWNSAVHETPATEVSKSKYYLNAPNMLSIDDYNKKHLRNPLYQTQLYTGIYT